MNATQALDVWRGAIVESVRRDSPDLSARQMAVLTSVYLSAAPQTVRGLSETLGIAKPAVTRALDRLCDLGLLRRKPDPNDRRSVLIQRTVKGSVYLSEFGELIVAAMREKGPVSAVTPERSHAA